MYVYTRYPQTKISVELTMWGEPERVPIIFYYCDIALATGNYHHNIALWLGQIHNIYFTGITCAPG